MLPERRVVRGELLVPADELVQARVVVASGSNVMPSGARSISIAVSVTVASPDTSRSSIVSAGPVPGLTLGMSERVRVEALAGR